MYPKNVTIGGTNKQKISDRFARSIVLYPHFYVRQPSAMLKHVIDIGWTSVRLSVCLSVRYTLVLYQNY